MILFRVKNALEKVGKTVWLVFLTLTSRHTRLSILPQPNSESCYCCFFESTDDGIRKRHFAEVMLLLHPYLSELEWLPSCCHHEATVFIVWLSFSSCLTFWSSLETASLVTIPVVISCGSLSQVGSRCVYRGEEVVKKASLGDSGMENFEISNNWKQIGSWNFDIHLVLKDWSSTMSQTVVAKFFEVTIKTVIELRQI